MTNSLKRAFTLIKYGFQIKTNLFSALLIFVISIPLCVLNHDNYAMGALYFVLAPMFLVQIQFSLLYCHIVKSSPLGRTMEIELTDILSTIIGVLGYTLLIFFMHIKNLLVPDTFTPVHPLLTALLIGILMLYFALTYKYLVLGMFLLMFCTLPLFTILMSEDLLSIFTEQLSGLNMLSANLLGYVILGIALVLSGLLRRAVYKCPLSMLASGSKLRKQL